jgi:hypothetical protein
MNDVAIVSARGLSKSNGMMRRMTQQSPFPGMDPWLEDSWGGVHTRLVTYACDQLQSQLGQGLIARLEERVYVEVHFEEGKHYVPDVHVYEQRKRSSPRRSNGGGLAVAEPKELIPFPRLDVREAYIEIRDHKARERLITLIEFVSPVNKRGKIGRSLYQRKQRDAVKAEVNIVEVDLLRAGKPITLAGTHRTTPMTAPYHASICRSERMVIEWFPMSLREKLPVIPIPLRPKDVDATLDLQALVALAYRNGRYAEALDYRDPPYPALKGDDATWAKRQIAAWRKKSA